MSYQPDDDHDPEAPDPSDLADDDGTDTEPCPRCGKPVYEQAEICHHCGSYIGNENSPGQRKLNWTVLATMIIVALLIVVWVMMGA